MPYITVVHKSPLPTTTLVGRIPPPSSAKLLATTITSPTPTTASSSRMLSPCITSIPIPRGSATRERRSPHHISVNKRKRLASSSSSSSAMAFTIGSPKEKRRIVFPTPPHDDDRSGYLNAFDEDYKLDDESLLFPMETPISPPYFVGRDIVVLPNSRSDINLDLNNDPNPIPDTKATSDLLKGLGIRVADEGGHDHISIKYEVTFAAAAAAARDEDDLDRTFLFDEEVGVGEFQSFLAAEKDEESELESDLDDYFN